MTRKYITQEELIDWMNNRLHGEKDFQGCKLSSIVRIDEDETGCNWDVTVLRANGSPVEIYIRSAAKAVSAAKYLFNVKQ